MRLSIVSDEISHDFSEAVDIGVEWGITDYELRFLNSGRVPFVSKKEMDMLENIKDEKNVNISAISPGLFQISLRDEVQLKLQIEEQIYESFRFAEKLDTRNVIIFGFKRYAREPQTNYIQIVHILGRMASLAEKYGFTLLLENIAGSWANTGSNTAMILDDVNSKHLKANWDLANALIAGEIPYPYGYLAIRKHIHTIHVKDIREHKTSDPEIVLLGDGSIDWEGQFRAIMNGLDINYLTVETQCKPLIENSRRNVLRIKDMLKNFELDENFIVK
ncbi:hypothetical protein B6I21_08550 [candidate division KSB1 bacterium 4572_119]|nr:MAG: hypothetical protein B6I21_08550 [candidate division KSB1 bacterium 4572_119]